MVLFLIFCLFLLKKKSFPLLLSSARWKICFPWWAENQVNLNITPFVPLSFSTHDLPVSPLASGHPFPHVVWALHSVLSFSFHLSKLWFPRVAILAESQNYKWSYPSFFLKVDQGLCKWSSLLTRENPWTSNGRTSEEKLCGWRPPWNHTR